MLSKFYYSKPDGEDLAGKSIICAKRGVILGVLLSSVYSYAGLVPKSAVLAITRTLRTSFYLGVIGFIFANGTYISTKIRGKDDKMNHFFGGLCTGPMFKSFIKLPAVEIAEIVLILSIFAMANKYRTNVKSGHETPWNYVFDKGIINRNPNFDYWDYITGEITPLDHYAN